MSVKPVWPALLRHKHCLMLSHPPVSSASRGVAVCLKHRPQTKSASWKPGQRPPAVLDDRDVVDNCERCGGDSTAHVTQDAACSVDSSGTLWPVSAPFWQCVLSQIAHT